MDWSLSTEIVLHGRNDGNSRGRVRRAFCGRVEVGRPVEFKVGFLRESRLIDNQAAKLLRELIDHKAHRRAIAGKLPSFKGNLSRGNGADLELRSVSTDDEFVCLPFPRHPTDRKFESIRQQRLKHEAIRLRIVELPGKRHTC